MQGAKANLRSVRNLAYLALSEIASFDEQVRYVRCVVWCNLRDISSGRVCSWRLAVLTQDMILKGMPRFYLCRT